MEIKDLLKILQTTLIMLIIQFIKNYQLQGLPSIKQLPLTICSKPTKPSRLAALHFMTLFTLQQLKLLFHLYIIQFQKYYSSNSAMPSNTFLLALVNGKQFQLLPQEAPTFFIYNIFLTSGQMGNKNVKMQSEALCSLMDELCSLTHQECSDVYHLSSDPFAPVSFQDLPCISAILPLQSMFEEAEETQPLKAIAESQFISNSCLINSQAQVQIIQKNQISKKLTKKVKMISKADKPRKGRQTVFLNPQKGELNSIETTVDQGIRDQNNCKSYHKLVKNYLTQKGLGQMIEKYESKYHTRYYFIVALLMIKHYLKEDFTSIYQSIVNSQLIFQQKKIDRKSSELKKTKEKIRACQSTIQQTGSLKRKEASLENQIEHIKVVKFEIENYSVRSCRAFFQGEIEESLKILYLKNDPVMRKKYYFQQALENVKNIQSEMRLNASHT